MAPESSQKKRKAGTAASSPTTKKSKKAASTVTKTKNVTSTVVAATPSASASKPARNTRKTAADFLSDSEESDGGWNTLKNGKDDRKKKNKPTKGVASKEKASKKDAPVAAVGDAEKGVVTQEADTEDTNAKNAVAEAIAEPDDGESESEDEDRTTALLQGFESSDDDMDDDAEVDGKKVAKSGIPNEKKVKKKLKGLSGRDKTTPGIIYLGRIPHGFYEHEMRSYFSQFGAVTRLRLSRNKKTGKSKHYAFIEFADEDVAAIVADTMNNYLLFGHILKCKVVPRDNVEYIEKLMKGANKRFKPRPGAKLAKAEMEKKKPEESWEKVVEATNEKRKQMKKKWEEKGIEYEFVPPVVTKAKGITVVEKPQVPQIEGPVVTATETPMGEAIVAKQNGTAEASKKTKKAKKPKKAKA